MFKLHSRLLCVLLPVLSALPVMAQAPVIFTGGTVNGADYSRDLSPGAIVSIFGSNLASGTAQASSIPLPTNLLGTMVRVAAGGTTQNLPLWYVSPGQINAQLPYGISGSAQVTVVTAGGTSGADTITLVARAPKIFTINYSGTGRAVATNVDSEVLTESLPAAPAGIVTVWMNSFGETSPPATAGSASPGMSQGTSPAVVSDDVTATIDGKAAKVTFVGLAPGYSGLYQVNLEAPFSVLTGPLNIQVAQGTTVSQASVTVPYRALGYYNAVVGGKPVTGQPVTGVGTLAWRHNDTAAWTMTGYQNWVTLSSAPPIDSTVAGMAVTLKNGSAIVYDNNGIETGTTGTFYDNRGGGADSTKPGLANLFSMSNYFPGVFATRINLTQATTITDLIGYFDPNNTPTLPFDPNNPYVSYRVNIWSGTANLPKETMGFTGDILSSDTAAGTMTIANTGVTRISSLSSDEVLPDPIWRLTYHLNSAITLQPGDYWFSHDAAIRSEPAEGSNTVPTITLNQLSEVIGMQAHAYSGQKVRFSFFGKEMTYQNSWSLPTAVRVMPNAPITVNQ